MSQAHTGLQRFPPGLLQQLHDRYDGRVFAFDHFTVSADPTENVRWLAGQLPDAAGLTVDIVAHSRGGLVGRVLAERGTELGLDGKITVRTLIMVGTPNAGTALADREHLGGLLDRVTNLVQLIPDNPVSDTIEIVITVLKQLAVGAVGGLAGLMSMNPRGHYLTGFLNKPASTNATYRAVASNFEPLAGSPLLRIARDATADIVFSSTHNDLIVPTDGVYKVPGLDGFAPADPLIFPAETGVDHSSYWNQPAFADRILTWLPAGN
jgi:pimeloyl-ACP methyl ester carboxylesterase